ncbi:MAG: TRL-like family protein [Nitrospira sp.]|nr:TRL-like family protein [Nitrospira sp.]
MKRMLMSLGVVAFAASLYGCSGVAGYTQPAGLVPTGWIFHETTSGSILNDNGTAPTKTGKACGTGILGMVATGDTSVEAAMNNGGIKKVVYTEQYIKSILGVYVEVCTVAKGN